MSQFEINQLKEMVALKKGAFRKISHFGSDHFEGHLKKLVISKSITSKNESLRKMRPSKIDLIEVNHFRSDLFRINQ